MANYTLPNHTGLANIVLTAQNAIAYEESPFTYSGQVQSSTGERWLAEVTLPPMHRTDAEQWVAFLLKLRGQTNTFLLGDPLNTSTQGLASSLGDTLTASVRTDFSVTISGATANQTNYFKAGDNIQIGTGASATLHKVLEDASSGAGGGVTVDVWPEPRRAVTGLPVYVNNTVGAFRLASSETSWTINDASFYGINFSAMEAV